MRKLMRIAAIALCVPAMASAAPASKDYDFTYTYPPQARAIPALKAWLEREAAKARAEIASEDATDRRDAAKDKRSFNPYDSQQEWKVVTDTPRFLSLSLEAYEFTGGAHGNTAYDSLVWDKTSGQRRTALSFFTSKAALAAAVRPAFCRQLDAQRRQKRDGELASGTSIDDFDKCIDPAAQTVILGSTNRRLFDRIGFLIAPYAAGPYSEGQYEVTVPVTPGVIATVRPEYRSFFAVQR